MSENKKYSEEFELECEDVDEYPQLEFMNEDDSDETEEEIKKSEEQDILIKKDYTQWL